MNRLIRALFAVSLSLLPVVQGHAAETFAPPADMSDAEAKRLLDAFYKKEETAARIGDIKGSVAALTEETHFSFDGHHYVGRSAFEALYPKDYKDVDYRIESLRTVVKGDEILNLAVIHGRTPGPNKAYLMYYHFQKRDGQLVLVEFVSSTINESAVKR
jgi:hypothetical protein